MSRGERANGGQRRVELVRHALRHAAEAHQALGQAAGADRPAWRCVRSTYRFISCTPERGVASGKVSIS